MIKANSEIIGQYGSNANGKYIKFSNGIVICMNGSFLHGTVEAGHKWQDGPLYGYMDNPFPDFPVKLIEKPLYYNIGIANSATIYGILLYRNGSTTGVSANNVGGFYIFSGQACKDEQFYANYIAIGRWK